MRRLLLSASFIALSIAASAQCGTSNARAFLEVHHPGNIPVDDNGRPRQRPVDSVYTIYLQSATDLSSGGSAWINGRTYTLNAQPAGNDAITVGKAKYSGETITLPAIAGKASRRWRIELQAQPFWAAKKAPAKARARGIVVQWNRGGKTCIQTIGAPTELATIPAL